MEAARYWLPRALGLLSFLWFAVMAAPTFYWLDSAELSAAAIGLGSPHASGFPLYMMLAKAASLIPVGELAFRINLVSALCGAFAVGGVARLVLVLGREDWATVAGAAGAGGVVCFSYLFARQATVAEVYAPTAALIVLTLLLFERVAAGGNARAGLSLAWLAGLGFAVHPEFRMLMGLPIVALLCLRAYRGARWPLLAPSMAIFGALGSYLYLPVRSATGRIASLDLGHPDSLGRTWEHGTSTAMFNAVDERIAATSREYFAHDVSTFAGQVLDYVGVLAVLAGLVGVVLILVERRTRWVGVAVAVILVLDLFYATWISPIGLLTLQNGVPMVLALSIGAGGAVAALARSAGAASPYLGPVVAFFMVVPPALSSLSTLSLSGDLPRYFSESVLHEAPVGALVLSQGNALASGTRFLQSIEGARPDVAALAISNFDDSERVAHVLTTTRREAEESVSSNQGDVFALWKAGRATLWEPGPIAPPAGASVQPGPVVGRLVEVGKALAPNHDVLVGLSRLYGSKAVRDPAARRVLANSLTHLGAAALDHGDAVLADELFRSAIHVRPTHAAALLQVGEMYATSGDLQRAVVMAERALESEPNRPEALLTAARFRLALGDSEQAEAYAKRALRIAPKSAASWTIAGQIDLASGRMERARSRLQRALEIDPGHGEAQRAMRAIAAGR
tara:strand:- start:232853 stop:234898 length:2046 start_codon:yes stop_codon:yes gene_type:complete